MDTAKCYANQAFELLENNRDLRSDKNEETDVHEVINNTENQKLFDKKMFDTEIKEQRKSFNDELLNDTSEDIDLSKNDEVTEKSGDQNVLAINDDGVTLKFNKNNVFLSKIDLKTSKSSKALESIGSLKRNEEVKFRISSVEDDLCSSLATKGGADLSRSQYSLVSCGEVTQEALQIWVDLPEEVKYDSSLEPFRQLYEKEHGRLQKLRATSKDSVSKFRRLPLVKSAPHLHNNLNNLRIVPDQATVCDGTTIDGGGNILPTNGDNNGECIDDKRTPQKSKMIQARYYARISILLACWLFFTIIFMLYNEKEEDVRNTSVAPGETRSYILEVPYSKLSVLVCLSGPFVTEQFEKKLNSTDMIKYNNMEVWVERWRLKIGVQGSQATEYDVVTKDISRSWTIVLRNEKLDFTTGESRSSIFSLQTLSNKHLNQSNVFAIRLKTNSNQTTPFTMSYKINPLDVTTGVYYSLLLLIGLYGLIVFEVINRTMAAIVMSTISLAVLTIVGERPSVPEIMSWLDVETLLLLFSMMLLVSILAETGMFDSLAVFTFEVTKGKIWPLITLLCAVTALLSTFLDNVTTVLLMGPVTIRLCEVTGLDPVPILMSMVLYSNIGGTATPVGDPPNVIIASNKFIKQAGINFTNFTLHMTLGILLVCVQTYLQLRYWHIDTKKLRRSEPTEIQELRHQISIWRRAAESLPHLSKDEQVVKERLDKKIRKLNCQLESMLKETRKRACPKDSFQATLSELKIKYKIRDKILLVKASVATTFVVAVFFLHSIPEFNRISLGWTALLGAILLLILADREELEPILHRVEWSTLLFFAALFVLMEALSKLGLIEFIGGLTEKLILNVDESARLAVSILLMLWVSGLVSAFIDNIPLTTMMVRVVTLLGANPNLNLPMPPLIWALSFGACLGGNGTLIGASANVLCAGVAEQHGYKFTFMQFFKIGFPVMIGHLIVSSAYLLVCHCVFCWH